MTDLWWPIDQMKRTNRTILVRWGAWTGKAMLLQSKRGGQTAWAEPVREGKKLYFDPLPTRAMVETCGVGANSQPNAWQPLDVEWPDALGAPLPVQPHHLPRMVTIGGVAFDATAAAEEMQAERDRRAPDEPALESLPWWRDPAAITYAPRGQISERDAEGRVMRALYFLGPDEQLKPYRTNAAVLADLKHAFELANGDATASYVPRLNTTLTDTPDNLLAAMEWFCELALGSFNTAYALHARGRNVPRTFADIAVARGYADQRGAHNAYTRGIARIHEIANTGTPRLDAIRARTAEGNRAYALTR